VQVGEEDCIKVFKELMGDLCEHKAQLEKELEISKNSELFLSRKVAKLEIQKT
jgi:hypothetical protein